MASLGHDVVAFDLDSEKIAEFSSGNLPFFEPGLSDLLKAGINSGKLRFTTELADAISNSEVHFICVGTPQVSESGAADLSQIHSAVKAMAPLLSEGSTVVGKSTVPVGTASWANQYFSEHAAQNVKLIWNPEFLREGFAIKDTLHPDRIVLGVSNTSDSSVVEDIYSSTIQIGTPVIVTDYATAELVKVAANAFLATKISFINAFADLCDVVGADVTTLADAIGHDTRIGRRFLNAGIGFGGGCLPKDIRALQARANELGMKDKFEFLNQIDHINTGRRSYLVQQVAIELGDVKSKNVAILGVAFKPDSDDIRDSPAISIAKRLIELGANVTVHDPEALQILSKINPEIKSSDKVEDALANADLVLHLTEWQQYRELDLTELSKLVKTRTIIDGRNILDRATWNSAGWKIIYLGRPSS
jgi:UDPglucose 6-dehydrogenase